MRNQTSRPHPGRLLPPQTLNLCSDGSIWNSTYKGCAFEPTLTSGADVHLKGTGQQRAVLTDSFPMFSMSSPKTSHGRVFASVTAKAAFGPSTASGVPQVNKAWKHSFIRLNGATAFKEGRCCERMSERVDGFLIVLLWIRRWKNLRNLSESRIRFG